MPRKKKPARAAASSSSTAVQLTGTTPADPAGVTPGTSPIRPDPLPPAEAPAREPSEPNTDRAEEAARAAAAGDQPLPDGMEGEPEQPAGELTPEVLVQLCEVALFMTVRVVAARRGVPFDDVAQHARFTPEDRAGLLGLAPAACPYLNQLLGPAPPWLGAAIFGVALGTTMLEHAAKVRVIEVKGERVDGAEPAPAARADSAPKPRFRGAIWDGKPAEG